jgi:chromosome segregation ATPase
MSSGEEQIKRIYDKLQQLLKQHASLQKENQLLREELESAQKQVAQYQETAEALKQQVSILQLGNGQMGEEDKKEFEKKLNTYIKEIDRCIAMLSE